MKQILLLFFLGVQSSALSAQNCSCCAADDIVREIRFPLTEQDTETVFYYFNDEWIAEGRPEMVDPDSIMKMEVRNDRYGNRAVFLTVSPETLARVKADAFEVYRNCWPHYDPICEFPGGNGKFKEWLDANIRVPEGYKGRERVHVQFYVEPDGTVTDPKIIRPSKNEEANAEALRLVNALPAFRVKFFTPKKTRLTYTCAITFSEPGAIFIKGHKSRPAPGSCRR